MNNSDVLPRRIEQSVTAFVTQRFGVEVPPGYQLEVSVSVALVQVPPVVVAAQDKAEKNVFLSMQVEDFFSIERLGSFTTSSITRLVNFFRYTGWFVSEAERGDGTVADFLKAYPSKYHLMHIPNLGKKSVSVIIKALEEVGIILPKK